MASGIDLIQRDREAAARAEAQARADKACAVTLEEVFQSYLQARKALKPRTVYDYQRAMARYFADWQEKPILTITKDLVECRHSQLGDRHGPAQANQGMRMLRAVLNFAASRYEDAEGRSLLPENPVKRLSDSRAWYRVKRRQTVIRPHDLPAWYRAVTGLHSDHSSHKPDVVRDYLLLVLFTGLRRQEAATLTWSQVDLQGRTLTVIDTKNHQPHTLPLSDFLQELLAQRQTQASSRYVFPGSGANGYMVEPKRQMQKVITEAGVHFTIHDLRRTFITVAESLDIPAYALKRLLNHKTNGDVTAGYLIIDVERLRVLMQKISDHILRLSGVHRTGEVVPLPGASTSP